MSRKPGEGAVALNTNLIWIIFFWKTETWENEIKLKKNKADGSRHLGWNYVITFAIYLIFKI